MGINILQKAKPKSSLPEVIFCVQAIKTAAYSHTIKLIACQDSYSADF